MLDHVPNVVRVLMALLRLNRLSLGVQRCPLSGSQQPVEDDWYPCDTREGMDLPADDNATVGPKKEPV